MADLKTTLFKTFALESEIKALLSAAAFDGYDELSGLHIDETDSDQLFLRNELQAIMMKFLEVKNRIAYLKRPVKETSRLHKNRQGRYETASGYVYTSGDAIEALIDNGYYDAPYWVRTSVEHNGKDYYLVKCQNICMNGLPVRRR